MTSADTLVDLFRHMAWADAAVWSAVAASEGARADAKLGERWYHLHVVQRAFLRVWRGEPRNAPYPSFDDVRALGSWARVGHGELLAHVHLMNDAQLAQPMPVPWARLVAKRLGRVPETTTVADTMLQVAFHSAYHRGQINTRLREVGAEPPLVDYIAWIWCGRPDAAWAALADGE